MSASTSNRPLKLAACAMAFAAAMGSSVDATHELQAIEKIEHYCTASWRNAGIDHQEWSDFTQQALVELLDRVSRTGLPTAIDDADSTERRELNRTVWRTIQRWRRQKRTVALDETRVPDARTAEQSKANSDAWDQVLSAGRRCLSKRQQQILELTRDGWRVAEIGRRLQIPAARVSDEKYKAIAKLQSQLGIA